MSILTKNEYLLTKYFTELQINKSASENLCKELVELLDIGTDISNGFLFNRLTMMLLGEYLTNDEIFFREYKKLRLEVYFLSEEHIKDMKQRLIALNHLHTGALKEEMIPNLKNFIEAIGSCTLASKKYNVSKSTVCRQCKHEIKTKPRCGYYFRYKDEYDEKGFVL